MKQRFSSIDVKIIAHELSASLCSLRVSNVYDLSTRIFLLKLAKPNRREQLIIDSGFRAHLTSFARSTAAAPSQFVARLRKFLRTRRITSIQQIGTDRVIEIQFSDGAYRLFLEFYAAGNIVLTDNELTILALLRTVSEGAEHEQYRLGLKYVVSHRQNYAGVPDLTKERLREGLQKAVEKQAEDSQKPGKKIKKKGGDALRKALAITTTEYPPVLIDHALYLNGFDKDMQPDQVLANEELLEKLLAALQEAKKVVAEMTSADITRGYIVAKSKHSPGTQTAVRGAGAEEEEEESQGGLLYEDFHPFKPAQLAADPSLVFLEHEGFNKTVDEFFSSLEGQKLESRLQEREDNAKRKIDQARQEQEKRIGGLQQVQELNVRKAQAIEANVERVGEVIAAVTGLIAQGMDWVDIGRLIENEQARHNPVAETIKLPLKLHENTVTLLLSEYDVVEDEELADETESESSDTDDEPPAQSKQKLVDQRLSVDIDLALSPWSNARQFYDQKRSAAVKQEKTAQASEKALRSTEHKVMADLKKGLKQEKDILRPVRKSFFFERFIYFISSDGYLVLAGKDAQQNETLYRKYLRKGDIYVHADLHGAASVIIKNNPATPEAPVPPSTLNQAGNLAVCTSSAWDTKAVFGAWWVNADQVSKTAPTGEYLTTGGFVIRGRKNFLAPAQLLLGFAVLFQISEESKARHVKHRLLDVDIPEAPDLTDGETIAESSVAGDGSSATASDDEFPDATPRPSLNVHDSSDEFPDATRTPESFERGDFGDASMMRHDFEVDDSQDESNERGNDDDDNMPRANPLQMNGAYYGPRASRSGHDVDTEDSGGDGSDQDALPTTARPEPHPNRNSQPDEQSNEDADEGTASASKPKPAMQKQVRGKRGKAKKVATKYAEQDEEDRRLAMKLLGSRAADEKRQAEKVVDRESAGEARARRRAQHDKAQQQGLEAEEIRRLNLEEGIEELDEQEAASLTQLDALIGTPLPGDEILEAIPVCAPWPALAKYKYKAKMQPGQQKKGKAMREILGKWAKDASDAKKVDLGSHDSEKIWPREAELLKGWKEAEVVGIIPVKSVRVMMSGGGAGDKGQRGKGGGRGGRGGKGSKRK